MWLPILTLGGRLGNASPEQACAAREPTGGTFLRPSGRDVSPFPWQRATNLSPACEEGVQDEPTQMGAALPVEPTPSLVDLLLFLRALIRFAS